MNDFVMLDPSAKRDYVPEWAGPKTDSVSATFNFEQKITDKLKFFANGLYTHSASSQDSDYNTGLSVDLAPGQAYNPFPAKYFSQFDPGTMVYFPRRKSPAARFRAPRSRTPATAGQSAAG
jgi:iron complex outermembrane receptor protein